MLTQRFIDDPLAPLPFDDAAFRAGVASQVLLHVPATAISHTMSELVRVCELVVVIAADATAWARRRRLPRHVFFHDYRGIAAQLGCDVNDVVSADGRIYFTLNKR